MDLNGRRNNMSYLERYRTMKKEDIISEKKGIMTAFAIMHNLRLAALTHNMKNPDNQIMVPSQDYFHLKHLCELVPDEYPVPYSDDEYLNEYKLLMTGLSGDS